MNGVNKESKVGPRRMLVRGGLAVVYIAVMVMAFILGKGHKILIDNKDSQDGAIKAFENVNVTIDSQDPIDFMAGDRDQTSVRSQWHTITIKVGDQQPVVKKVTLPLNENVVLLSIPKLMANVEPYVVPFVPADEPPPPADNSGNSNEFTSPTGTEAPAAPTAPAAAPTNP